MDQRVNEVNEYLVSIFNDVLMIEEQTLQMSQFKDVSIKEMHTIDAIGMYQE
ncbi:MAG: MarR family transcriptional regulator, partial [Pisciglobus halotolerans]|nr:MarR family transcriptional regulator [Pisciglobus halotolerans]